MLRFALVLSAFAAIAVPPIGNTHADSARLPTAGSAFIGAPVVERASDSYRVTVRVRRPLTDGARAALSIPSATADSTGLLPLGDTTDCYQQNMTTAASGAAPDTGERTPVRLSVGTAVVGGTASVTTAHDWSERHNRALTRLLGCHTPTVVRHCPGSVDVHDFAVRLRRVTGDASCSAARRVATRIAARSPEQSCSPRLCLKEGGVYAGFRCHSVYAGPKAWRVVCRRGRAAITGPATS